MQDVVRKGTQELAREIAPHNNEHATVLMLLSIIQNSVRRVH